MDSLNDALIGVYASFESSVDRLAASAALRTEFRSRLPENLRSVGDDELVRRLLNLRKRGKLPRSQAQRV